jgi:mycothiol system anti-sigma-R factor
MTCLTYGEKMANAPGSEDVPARHGDDNVASHSSDYAVRVLRYLNNELKGQELAEFRAHLDSCADCQAQLQAEEALSRLLHRTRPLYSAPAALRARVSAASIPYSAPIPVTEAPYQRVFQFLRGQLAGAGHRLLSLRVLAPALLVLVLGLTFEPHVVRQVQASSYVRTAVAEHRSYLSGDLPLELRTSSPQVVAAWFAGKVPFDFRLPAAESAPENEPAYQLTGAALVSYKGSPAALVTYESKAGKISLLVAGANSAVVAGGDEIPFGKLTFHYRTEGGYRVITWSNHGLAYALVSSVASPPKASCLVCHQNMADRYEYQVHP